MRPVVQSTLLAVVTMLSLACILPQEDTILPEECTATTACSCDCTLCTTRDPGGACSAVVTQQHFSSTCFDFFVFDGGTCPASIGAASDAGALNRACSDFCERDLRANGIDTVECVTKTQTLISNNDCIDSIENPLHTTANGSATADKIQCHPANSHITLSELDANGNVVKSASVQVECVGDVEEGSFHLQMLRIRGVGPLVFGGDRLDELRVGLIKPITGTIDPNGNFAFDGTQALFAGTGHSGGERKNTVFSPMGAIAGNYQRATGQLSADLALASEDGKTLLSMHLQASTTNRAPTAVISAPATAECVAGAAMVQLDGSASSDLDGMSLGSFLWYDGDEPIGAGQTLNAALGLGVHQIRLVVSDGISLASATQTVSVVDTQPPVIAVESIDHPCLWPVNHRLVRYEVGNNLVVSVTDACDGTGTLDGIASVSSSQPDDGSGDGTTAPDTSWSASYACLRAERAGTSRDARIYAIELRGHDRAGNGATGVAEVVVPHDQGGELKCARLSENALIDDGDPLCAAPAASAPGGLSDPEVGRPGAPGSCAAAPGVVPVGVWWLLLVALGRSRRRTTR